MEHELQNQLETALLFHAVCILDQSDKVECEEFARAIRLIMRQCDK